MPGLASPPLRTLLAAGLLLAASIGPLLAQDRVGVSSAVNPEATGTPPAGATRQLVIGQEVVYNERVTTGPAGQTQLLFLDESSMTIGPNSDLKIDQFVYDPKSNSGKLAMSATRGLLRYVGGKLSKQEDAVTLKTSTATLAVRGGAFIVDILPSGRVDATFIYGKALTITSSNGASTTVTRPGYQSSVTPGNSPTPPAPQPEGQLAQYLAQLNGQPGGSGGAPIPPTDTAVINSGIGQTVSGNIAQSIVQSQQNSGYTVTNANTGNNGGGGFTGNPNSNQLNNVNGAQNTGQVITCASQPSTCVVADTTQVGTTVSGQAVGGPNNGTSSSNQPPPPPPNPPGPPTPPAPPTTTISVAGRLKNTNGQGTANGFTAQAPPATNGDIPFSNGTLTLTSATTGTFTGNFGSFGTVTFPLAVGSASFGPTGTASSLGTFSGTSFLSADGTYFYANITPTSQPTQRLFISGGVPVNSTFYQPTGSTRIFAFSIQPDAALQSTIPFVRTQAGGNLPNARVSPLYVVAPATTPIGRASTNSAARALQASLAVSGSGALQQSAIAVTTGTIATSSAGQPILTGAMRGTSQFSAASAPNGLASNVSTTVDGSGHSFYGANSISGFVLDQTGYPQGTTPGTVGAATIPTLASEKTLSGSTTQYGFAQPVLPTPVQSGVGTTRTTQAANGAFAGLVYTNAQPNPYIVNGGTLVSTDAATNRVQATFIGGALSQSSGVNTVQMQYGGLTGTDTGRSAYVDSNNYAALESGTAQQQVNGQNLSGQSQLYMASSGTAGAPTTLLPPNASFCQCKYLQWGYWGGDLATGTAAGSNANRIDRAGINTWVAGVPTPLNDLRTLQSQSATATYSGAAVGSVFNNGASYMAAGAFNGSYNFGAQSGMIEVSNFDGKTFRASGKAPLTGAAYTFNVASPGIKGAVNGTFYGPMAQETGGTFAVQATVGPSYMAAGTFAGKR